MKSGEILIAALDEDGQILLEHCRSLGGRVTHVLPLGSSPIAPETPTVTFERGKRQVFSMCFNSENEKFSPYNIEIRFNGIVENGDIAKIPLGRVFCSSVTLVDETVKKAWGAIRNFTKRKFHLRIEETTNWRIYLGPGAEQWLKEPGRDLLIDETDYERLCLPRPFLGR